MSGKPNYSAVEEFDKLDGTDYGDGPEDQTDDVNESDDGADDTSDEADASEHRADDSGDSSDTTADSRPDPNDKVKDQKTSNEELRPLPGNFAQDARGNLYDRNGNLLARAGSERRLYERNVRMKADLDQLTQRNQQLENALRQNTNLGEEPRRLGLEAEDMRVGLPIIAEFKRNPVQAARNVLEMVMGMGHDLSEILGGNAKDAVEMKAISRMLDERLAPLQQITQSVDQQKREQRIQQQAEQEIERFFDEHENSRMHAQAIDNLIGRRPDLTPEKAYYELRLFAANNGLDFNKPLAPQLQALQQSSVRDGSNNRQQTRSAPPMANGVRGTRQVSMPEGEAVDAKASWDDIIRRSMQLRS
jgi:hypothetical protein